MAETYASLGPDYLFRNRILEEDFLCSLVFPLFIFLKFVFVGRARQNSSRSFPGTLMVCWLLLFPAKVIWNRANVTGRTTTEVFCKAGGVTVGYGLWICAASGRRFFCNFGTWHRVVKQTTHDAALRLFQIHVH